jgi:glycerophosphoryl diester phosphodiesterase
MSFPSSRILAHRGLWKDVNEKNSASAILRALESGFSIEIDIRDASGVAAVSHDPVLNKVKLSLNDLISLIDDSERESAGQVMALDVKSDGLLKLPGFATPESLDYFFFDMSIPEFLQYKVLNVGKTATRWSEYEEPLALQEVFSDEWIWLDSFKSDWWLNDSISLKRMMEVSKDSKVVIVSPELHGREPKQAWDFFSREAGLGVNLYICTDYPELVRDWS